MSDVVIRAEQLRKVYRLYKSPTDRIRDAFGLLRAEGRYSEHVALDGIDIAIRRGEKVGIIGRNGAGKSTLLKLITRSIEPTSGVLDVVGATQALLQIGTGFHPEFTGRDNVVSYLAQLGIAGDKASKLTSEVIEFAEVEEYIDQPVKTYSTGMAARLMFAASTVIEPDVLVIDEVLGVGDAYFARKSYERIKSLCSEHNSTLLLVSHDIYSSAQICERMIWIDRGRVKFDGAAKDAVNLYEASIKEQEEQRLRRKAAMAPGLRLDDASARHALVEIRSADSKPMAGLLFFYEAALADGSAQLARVDPVSGRSNEETAKSTGNALELVYEGSNWQTVEEAGRSDGIILANHGQPYHKGTFRARCRPDIAAPALLLSVESSADQTVAAVVYDGRQIGHVGGQISLQAGRRTEWQVPIDVGTLERASDRAEAGTEVRHGSGAVRITGVDILDAEGRSTRQLEFDQAASIMINYKILDPVRAARCEINIAIFRDGVQDVMRLFETELNLNAETEAATLSIYISRFKLAPGKYSATILVAKSGYYASASGIAFSVNPDVYDVLSRTIEFSVKPTHPAFNGTIAVQDADWGRGSHAEAKTAT